MSIRRRIAGIMVGVMVVTGLPLNVLPAYAAENSEDVLLSDESVLDNQVLSDSEEVLIDNNGVGDETLYITDGLESELGVKEGILSDSDSVTVINENDNNITVELDEDGNIASGIKGNVKWAINAKGKLIVTGEGDFKNENYGLTSLNKKHYSLPDWQPYAEKILSAEFHLNGVSDLSGLFYGCKNLETVDFSGMDTKRVTNMAHMFERCDKLKNIDMSLFDTSNVTDMSGMFDGCSGLTNLDITNFNTSNVTDMNGMFNGCGGLTNLDITNFNTLKVTDMSRMFRECSGLTNLDITNFNTSKVTDMSRMFYFCNGLTRLNITNFDTSNVTDMSWMFSDCYKLTNLDITNFDTSNVRNMQTMFQGCSGIINLNLSHFITSNVTDMSWMFNGCSGLTDLDITNFNTSNVTDMSRMFSGCSGLTNLNITNFNTSNVTDMSRMFNGCSGLTNLDIINFNTSKVTNMSEMFYGCRGLSRLDIENFDTSKVTDMSGMFSSCGALQILNLSCFDMQNVTSSAGMLLYCVSLYSVNCPKNLTTELSLPDIGWKNSFTGEEVTAIPAGIAAGTLFTRGNAPVISQYTISVNIIGNGKVFVEKNGQKTEIIERVKAAAGENVVFEFKPAIGCSINSVVVDGLERPWYSKSYKFDNMQSDHTLTVNFKNELPDDVINADIRLPNDGKKKILFKSDYFAQNSDKYIPELSELSICLSTMVYENEDYDEESEHWRMAEQFQKLGFNYKEEREGFCKKHYNGDPTGNKDDESTRGSYSPVWITHRPITIEGKEVYNLLCVVIRGTYKLEWIDNFDPGLGEDHRGFMKAAEFVQENVEEYVKENNLDSNIKILVTGHSRGAAAANLFGAMLDDGKVNGLQYVPKKDIYVYTYASPRVTRNEKVNDNRYNNIFNIINPEDFVTKVLPEKWGYNRYGINYVLPSKTFYPKGFYIYPGYDYYESQITYLTKKFIGENCPKEVEKYREYDSYNWGMKSVAEYVSIISLCVGDVNDYYRLPLGYDFFKRYSKKSSIDYVNSSLFTLFTEFLAYNRSGGKYTIISVANIAKALALDYWGPLGKYTDGFFLYNGVRTPQFGCAHAGETYMAMIDATPVDILKEEKKYNRIIVSCPVDVTVKNVSGNVIGSTIDNEVVASTEELELSVEGDSKMFMVHEGADYRIELVGNDIGNMDYTIIEYDADNGEIGRSIYQNIPLEKGTVYTQSLAGVKNAEDAPLSDSESNVIEKTLSIEKDELGHLSIAVNIEGNGYASGYPRVTPGDYIVLSAVPMENNEFIGWYDKNGQLLSTDPEYGFSVKESVEVAAKFTANEVPVVEAESIGVEPVSQTIRINEEFSIFAILQPIDVTDRTVIWTSDNNDVAIVSGNGITGIVTGKSEGTATITATTTNGKAAECIVTVIDGSKPQPQPEDWGDIENLPNIKKLFKNVKEVPSNVWYVFEGDDSVYLPSSLPQITKVNKNYTSGKILFDDEIYVFYGTEKLAEGRDYKVKYKNNIEAAQASDQGSSPSVIIKGMGGCYKGSEDFRFTISNAEPVKIDANVKIAGLNTQPEYTGNVLTLVDLYTSEDKSGYDKVTLYVDKEGEKTALTEGQDYTFDGAQLRKEGTFTLRFELMDKYEGSVISAPITVQPYNVKKHVKSGDSKISVKIEDNPLFNKSGAEPKITVKFNETELKQGVDYSVSYSRNKRFGQKAKARINFMGYFTGSVVEYFETSKKDVSLLTLQTTDKKYKETPGNFKMLPVVCDGDKAVSKSKDIYKYNIADNCEYLYAEGDKKGEKIADDTVVPNDTLIEVKVSVKSRENGPYTGEAVLSGTYRVYGEEKNIKKAALSPRKFTLYTRNGDEVIPKYKQDFTLMMPGENSPLSEEYFDIVSVTRNRFIGTATVTVRGKNGYGGTKRFTFKVIKRKL